MTTSRKAHDCTGCNKKIEAGKPFIKQRRGKKSHPACHERRLNRRMDKENVKLRNLILFLTFICFLLFAVDDKYAAALVLAFAGWVMYVSRYCRRKNETSKR